MKDSVFREILKPITSDLIKKYVSIFNSDYAYDKFKTYGLFLFSNPKPRGGKKNLYTSLARRISVTPEGKEPLILVTNLLDEPAEMIAELYKSRWDVELFFKWIKQRLKIKKFLGKSENAVKIQLITAIIAYILVFLFKSLHIKCWPLYLLIIWIRANIDKPVNLALKNLYLKLKPPQTIKSQETSF